MADQHLFSTSVGHVYAQALVNLAQKQNSMAAITEDVRGIEELLNRHVGFVRFAEAATISPEDKMAAVEKIFGGRVQPIVVQTLRTMARHDRLQFIRGFTVAFEGILEKLANQVDVELTTAAALPERSVERVRSAVASAIGKTPMVATKVDPTLIGGIRLRIGDTLIDGSVQTQLEQMKQRLRRQGSASLQQKFSQVVAG